MFAALPFPRLFAFCGKRLLVVICAVFGCFLCGLIAAAPGQLDPTFGSNGIITTELGDSLSNATLVFSLSDDKVLLVGACDVSKLSLCLTRYRANGLLDETFGVSGKSYLPTPEGEIYPVSGAPLTNGRLVVSGRCWLHGPYYYTQCIWLIDANGQLVSSFNGDGTPGYLRVDFGQTAYFDTAVAVIRDGSFLITGTCDTDLLSLCLAKVTSTGHLDT